MVTKYPSASHWGIWGLRKGVGGAESSHKVLTLIPYPERNRRVGLSS